MTWFVVAAIVFFLFDHNLLKNALNINIVFKNK